MLKYSLWVTKVTMIETETRVKKSTWVNRKGVTWIFCVGVLLSELRAVYISAWTRSVSMLAVVMC